MNNAQFFLYLAEHGKSFAPHTPKRRSDQIGLFRAICWELIRARCVVCKVQLGLKPNDIAIVSDVGQHYVIDSKMPVNGASPLARLRILLYFEPIMGRTERLLSRVLAE